MEVTKPREGKDSANICFINKLMNKNYTNEVILNHNWRKTVKHFGFFFLWWGCENSGYEKIKSNSWAHVIQP